MTNWKKPKFFCHSPWLLLALCCLRVNAEQAANSGFDHFITVKGDQLMDGSDVFRFISWNIPNLLVVEDNLALGASNDWRAPNEFELRDALATVKQMGGSVARTYSITVLRSNETTEVPKHVLGIGKFNEEMFRSFDLALKIANEQRIRLIIPLVNNWIWQGGREQYAAWRGKDKDAFWNDPQIIADFEKTIQFVIQRTNTLTGIRYADDKSILAWETGNEVRGNNATWTRKIAAYIKSLDTNHLVMDGNDQDIRQESLNMPEIDIVTTHHYPSMGAKSFAEQIRANAAMTKGRKPYIVGEFGFVKIAQMKDAMEAIIDSQCAGGMLWSLRFRNRDGGFYWHSEPDGAGKYKAFHWPGSAVGDAYDERALLKLVQKYSFRIQDKSVPPIALPDAPVLLPIIDVAEITWLGSVGTENYLVQRAESMDGTWQTIAEKVDESFVQYHPLFADESVKPGNWYYRVIARNAAGLSAPSNIAGPVRVEHPPIVDELGDFERTAQHSGKWELVDNETRKAHEDIHRAAGEKGSTLTYKLPEGLVDYCVTAFFPGKVAGPTILISSNDVDYSQAPHQQGRHFGGAGDYGYWQAEKYSVENLSGEAKFLKINLNGSTQISRIELHQLR